MKLIDYLEEDNGSEIYIKVSKKSVRRLLRYGKLKILTDDTTIKKATIEVIS